MGFGKRHPALEDHNEQGKLMFGRCYVCIANLMMYAASFCESP